MSLNKINFISPKEQLGYANYTKCVFINWQANKPPAVVHVALNTAEFSCHYAL